MPLYDFYDSEIKEYFSLLMRISEKEEFLKENEQIKQVHVRPPMIVANVGTIDGRMDSGWKENLERIAAAHPRSALAQRYHTRDAKEVKLDAVVDKAKKSAIERNKNKETVLKDFVEKK